MKIDPILKQNKSVETIAKLLYTSRQYTHKWMSEIFRDWLYASLCLICRKKELIKFPKEERILFAKAFKELYRNGKAGLFEDVLGPIYMALASFDHQRMGQFFTPQNLSDMMAAINLAGIEDSLIEKDPSELIKVLEPSSGSGVMLLSSCRYLKKHGIPLERFHFTAVDLDRTCCMMTTLQLAIYGVPNWVVFNGNFLKPEELTAYSQNGIQPEAAAKELVGGL